MSDGQDIRGEDQGASSPILNAQQAHALSHLLDVFYTGDPVQDAAVSVGVNHEFGAVAVTLYAALEPGDTAADEERETIDILLTEDGRYFGVDAKRGIWHWLTPVRVPVEFPDGTKYAAGLIGYRSEDLFGNSVPSEIGTWRP